MIRKEDKEEYHLLFLTQMTSKMAGFLLEMNQFMLNAIMGSNHHAIPQQLQIQKINGLELSQTPIQRIQNKTKTIKVKTKTKPILQNEKPKGPTSSFLIYYHQNKFELAKKFGEINVSKLTKLASQQWKNLPQKQRQEYQKKSDQSKRRYQRQMQIYKEKYAEQLKQETRRKRVEYRLKWMNKKKAKQAEAKQAEDFVSQISSQLELSKEEKKDVKSEVQELFQQK